MSYNSELQNNNDDLRAILNTVNALPEAGGGSGGVETCTVTIVNELTDEYYGLEDFVVGTCFLDVHDGEEKRLMINFSGSVTPGNPKTVTVSNVICGSSLIALCDAFRNGNRKFAAIIDGNANVASCLYQQGSSIKETCPGHICHIDILGDCTITLAEK